MDVLTNILLGAAGSIVATIILYICSSLYKIGYKDDVRFNIETARVAVYQIQNQHSFPEDYALVIAQIDVLHQCAYNIYRSLRPLSMIWNVKSRKMIITLIYDIIHVCERSKYMTIGYSGLDEKEARLREIHEAFYKYAPLDETNTSTVIVQLDIVENLFNGKSIDSSIKEALGNMAVTQPIEDLICDGFIHLNSLKQNNDTGLRKKCFTRKELESILRCKAVGKR